MTETTALLRALHCDLVATNGLLAALLYERRKDGSPYAETISLAIQEAGEHYRIANEIEGGKAQHEH
nr:MAG TPA: hypothetical protein [Caudoviricetes sp.]